MKRMIWIALVAVITMVMSLGSSNAAEQDVKKYLESKQGNGIKYSGAVKVTEISEEELLPADKDQKPQIGGKTRNLRVNYTGAKKVTALSNGVTAYAMPMKGEWFRLGPGFSGANSISEMLKVVCDKLYVSAVLKDNNLTDAEARRLPVGYGVFIRHAYLQEKYQFSLEKLVAAYGEIEVLKDGLKEAKAKLAGDVGKKEVADLENLQQALSAKTAVVEKLNSELKLRDGKITALEKENAALKDEITKLKADLAAKDTEVSGLKDELKGEQDKRIAFAKEVRTALQNFLARLDELEKQ